MDRSRHDEALARYQWTWRWTALFPSSTVLLVWTYLVLTCEIEGTRAEAAQRALHAWLADRSMEFAVWMAAAVLHLLFVLSPMLAWRRVRTWERLRNAMKQPPTPAPRGAHHANPRTDRSWQVSGPFPRWATTMFVVGVIINACWRLSWLIEPYVIWSVAGWWAAALAHVCFCYAWWRRCRRGALRVGVIEETVKPDGSPGLVLYTPREVRHVTIAEHDRFARTFRLFGSPEVWQAVDPIDELVSVDDTHTRRRAGRGERARC
jgi:hypothetical protein